MTYIYFSLLLLYIHSQYFSIYFLFHLKNLKYSSLFRVCMSIFYHLLISFATTVIKSNLNFSQSKGADDILFCHWCLQHNIRELIERHFVFGNCTFRPHTQWISLILIVNKCLFHACLSEFQVHTISTSYERRE